MDDSSSSYGSINSFESPVRHTRNFEVLADAARAKLATLADNQLITFRYKSQVPNTYMGIYTELVFSTVGKWELAYQKVSWDGKG